MEPRHISRSFGVRWRSSHPFGRGGETRLRASFDGCARRGASITCCESSRFRRPPKAAAGRRAHSKVLRTKRCLMLDGTEAYFAKLWSAVAIEPPLWEGGGNATSRVV